MEVKFTVSGPPIGGAKSGINFDPKDPRKEEVLKRWYKAVMPLLKRYYGTGGDLNIDEIHEVIPITEEYGLWHPQEGVVNGHLKPTKSEKIQAIGQLRMGVSKVLEDPNYTPSGSNKKYVVADMITGYGVSESVKHYYSIYGGDVKNKKVIIQGWGNVASAAACYLSISGAKIVGIIDRAGGLIHEEGFTTAEIKKLFLDKENNTLTAKNLLSFEEINKKIWDVKADVFIPAAGSRLITREQIESLINAGLEVIACGANVPFADKEIFFGPIAEYTDNKISLIPDFIANCGMARVFAYLMQHKIELSDEAIFNDTSKTIYSALKKSYEVSNTKTEIAKTAFKIALNQLL
jgi:glutamate dehydrogenase/leucine dehydrogenase